ncbi:MAG: transposase [Verrucomicrobiales bacterium]|nr:transposase [Verrucomicrobiales bacterium]
MKLLTKSIRNQLIENYRKQQSEGEEIDFKPIVKLFTPDAGATWLLTELNPEHNVAFGLCDLGLGFPELGYVSLEEIESIRGGLGLPVERDRYFEAKKRLSEYAVEAREKERICA